jgi:uncharacterized protein
MGMAEPSRLEAGAAVPPQARAAVGPDVGAIVGRVLELWRYPVKSMQGECVESLEIDEHGVVGDRRWAVLDESTGRLLHGRTTRPLLQAASRLGRGMPVVTLPGGEELHGPSPATDGALSAWLGRPVRLVASQGANAQRGPAIEIPTDGAFASWTDESLRSIGPRGALARMRAQKSAASPEADRGGTDGTTPGQVLVLPSLPGTFNDCEPVHLLSEAELAAGRSVLSDGQWDRRRFRPNLLVDDAAGRSDELEWVGFRLSIGTVELAVTEPTLRCAMTTADQPGLAKDPRILGTLARERGAYLGRYARVVRPGTIRAGDPIILLGVGEAIDLELFAFYRDRIRG